MQILQRSAQLFSRLVYVGVAIMTQLPAPGALAEPPAAAPFAPLRIGVALAPKTLNPLLAADSAGARILHLTHPALLRYGPDYTPQPQLAQGCTQPTLTQVVCTLGTGRRFTSGAPITAQAVATWLGTVQNTPQSPLSAALRGVSITTPNATTLAFTLPSATLAFMGTLTELPIADAAAPTFGAGPYVATHAETTGIITLTPSPSTPSQPLPALSFVPLADPTTRLLKLQKGELDVLFNDLPPSVVRYATTHAAKTGISLISAPSTAYTYVVLNFNNPYLAQASVREALSLGLNRPLLRKALLDNRAAVAESLLPMGHAALWAAPEDPYDRMSAEGLLDDTQLPDGRTLLMGPEGSRVQLTLLTSTEAFTQRLAQALQAQWREIGVDVKLQSAEWGSFFSRVQAGNFDMALLTWTGEQQPAFYRQVFHSGQTPPNGFNRGHAADANLDALLEDMMAAPGVGTLNARAQKVQQAVASLRPYLPLWRRHNVLLMGQGVGGCTLTPSGDYRGLITCRRSTPNPTH